MLIKLFILLFEIGFGITFNVIGTISMSEVFLILGVFWYIKTDFYKKFPVLKTISLLYLGLLLSQILSELIVGNELNNSLRGYAVTIVSYLHFIFLFSFFIKNRLLIVYALIGMLAKQLIFGTEFEGSVGEVLDGEGATFLKFYVAPIVTNGLLLISVFLPKKNIVLLFFLVGLAFIILGARSSGLIIVITALITFIILFGRSKINKTGILIISFITIFLSYGLYILYVNRVLEGSITSGNSAQLKEASNPYNPINLLVMGRTETFVGWVAFMDEPWFGHGAWAKDATGKYRMLIFKIRDTDYREIDLDVIPAHSVLIGTGMQNGIFALFFMVCILIYFLKFCPPLLNKRNKLLLLLVYFAITIIWVFLFSPSSHFRLTIPLYFAFILASFLVQKKRIYLMRRKQKLQSIRKSAL